MAAALEVIPWGTHKRLVPEYDMVKPVNHIHRQIPEGNPLGRGSSRIRTDATTALQAAPFVRSGMEPLWAGRDSNPRNLWYLIYSQVALTSCIPTHLIVSEKPKSVGREA